MLAVFDIDARGKVIVNSFFNLVYYSNKGISFSMLQAAFVRSRSINIDLTGE